jgi:DUF971 family protein
VDERHQAVNTDVKRDTGVTITFADGYVADFDLMTLRLACACASCRGLRERDQDTWPLANSPLPLRINDAELHGAWGVRITWNDDHATGIFPFAALRDWHEAGRDGAFADYANGNPE